MRIAVITSGGDSPGMNAAIRAVVREAANRDIEIVGFFEGYRGLVEQQYQKLDSAAVSEIIDRGGTILRTSRYEEFYKEQVREKAVKNLNSLNIDSLVVIGGEGSLHAAHLLTLSGLPVIGVPASIDNDIYGTDFSIGFDTAVNTVVAVLSKIRDTASAHERVFVVEVMGRRFGAIALHAGLAGGADYICLPDTPVETPYILEDIINVIEARYRAGKRHTIIIIPEGAGSAYDVATGLRAGTEQEIRVLILGHMQRGGSPSAWDRLLASLLGSTAVELLAENKTNLMVGWKNGQLVEVPLAETFTLQPALNPKLVQLAKRLSI